MLTPVSISRMPVVVGCVASSAAVESAAFRGPTRAAMSGNQPNLGVPRSGGRVRTSITTWGTPQS